MFGIKFGSHASLRVYIPEFEFIHLPFLDEYLFYVFFLYISSDHDSTTNSLLKQKCITVLCTLQMHKSTMQILK
jgi:hypothetical protein